MAPLIGMGLIICHMPSSEHCKHSVAERGDITLLINDHSGIKNISSLT